MRDRRFFFKVNNALDLTSIPSCTYVTVDEVEACAESAAVSVQADADACAVVVLGVASSAADCGAVMLDCASTLTGSCAAGCTDSGSACTGVSTAPACTHSVPNPAPQQVVAGEDRVIIGTPQYNLMARRLEANGPSANVALRFIKIIGMTDTGTGGGAINVQSGM